MKAMHIGDLHLGRTLREYSLIDDQKYILDQILDIIRSNDVKVLIAAGDIYDKSIPSEAAMNLLDDFLSSLADMKVETFIVSGNHDSAERLSYGSRLFGGRGIHIAGRYDGHLKCVPYHDEYGTVNMWMLPFVRSSRIRYYHPDAEIETYDDAIRTVIENADVDAGERNVLIAHQFVTGRRAPKLSGSESSSVQSVGTVDMIRYDIFDDFDYVALGHIHSPQEVGRETIRYSGSPLKYSLREAEDDKYVTLIDFAGKGEVAAEQVRLKPRRDLRHLRGELRTILSPENVSDTHDYIYVTLTDEDYIDNAEGIIRQTYPNFIGLDYDNSHTPSGEMEDLGEGAAEKTFDELISDFYLKMYGTEISDEEMAVMKAAARKAGVIDEAD